MGTPEEAMPRTDATNEEFNAWWTTQDTGGLSMPMFTACKMAAWNAWLGCSTARLAALEADALRYRWLREQLSNRKWGHLPFDHQHEYDDIAMGDGIDAAIDAAISQEPAEGG